MTSKFSIHDAFLIHVKLALSRLLGVWSMAVVIGQPLSILVDW